MTECWVTQVRCRCQVWPKVSAHISSPHSSIYLTVLIQLPNVQEIVAHDPLGRDVWLLVLLLCLFNFKSSPFVTGNHGSWFSNGFWCGYEITVLGKKMGIKHKRQNSALILAAFGCLSKSLLSLISHLFQWIWPHTSLVPSDFSPSERKVLSHHPLPSCWRHGLEPCMCPAAAEVLWLLLLDLMPFGFKY